MLTGLLGYAALAAAGGLYLKKRYPDRKRARIAYVCARLALMILGAVFYRPVQTNAGVWLMMPLLTTVAVEDAVARRVSNRILIAMLALGVLSALVCAEEPLPRLIAPVAYGLIFILLSLASKGGLGMGDAKLIAVLSAFYGLTGMFSALFAASLIECALSLMVLARTKNLRTELPFVPAIELGAIIALFWMI